MKLFCFFFLILASLIQRYITNKFDGDLVDNDDNDELNFNKTKSTIGLDCMSTIQVMRGHKICVEVWDTAGQGNKYSFYDQ